MALSSEAIYGSPTQITRMTLSGGVTEASPLSDLYDLVSRTLRSTQLLMTPYEWSCPERDCDGVLLTDRARPAHGLIVMCQQRPGAPYATSCHSRMRFDGFEERFIAWRGSSPESQ